MMKWQPAKMWKHLKHGAEARVFRSKVERKLSLVPWRDAIRSGTDPATMPISGRLENRADIETQWSLFEGVDAKVTTYDSWWFVADNARLIFHLESPREVEVMR